MYQSIKTRAITAYTADNAIWSWSCNGGSGLPSSDQSQSYKELDAYLYAFMSLVDPTDATYHWGCYGRDVFTYMMGRFVASPNSYSGNHWSDNVEAFALTADWLMGGSYLSSADRALTRQFLAAIAQYSITTSYGTSAPIGNYNSSAQFNPGTIWDYTGQRAMGNNYTESKILYLASAALTFNDNATDDPPLTNTCNATRYQVCPDGTAGSLHAYWIYLTGGMFYKDWAHLEDPNVSWQAYQSAYGNLPSQPTCGSTWGTVPCFGDGRGGEASEGQSYGNSISKLKWAMNAIHTAGYDDPILYGPQMSIATSAYWDLRYITDLEELTGIIPNSAGAVDIVGAYSTLTTGDTLYYYRYPSNYVTQSAMLEYNSYIGRTEGNNATLWTILETAFGGPLGTSSDCTSYCGFDSELSNDYASDVAIDLFIALPAIDPTTDIPADPRPSLPTDVYVGGNQHIMARSGWTTGDTLFSYYCPNTAIDHEHEFCGRFDIFRNGEYITKGRTEFNDYNDVMSTAPQQNIQAIQNITGTSCASSSACAFYPAFNDGGQIWHSYQGGLVSLSHAETPSYVAAIANTTNLYNGSPSAFSDYNDVTQASRSLVYLRGSNQVVFYDRSITGHAAFKTLYQISTGPLTVSGNTASWLTRSSTQRAYFTSLLPSGATVSDAGITPGTGTNQAPDWEPYSTVEVKAGTLLSANFLSVLEFGPSSHTKSTTTLVQSNSGTAFDGSVIGTSLVMFKHNWTDVVTGMAYPASGATTHYVADLLLNHLYRVTKDGSTASITSDSAGVITFGASGGGNITVNDSN
jgi:hypothetical protein